MATVFDVVEGSRAIPNGRTPFNDEIKVEKDIVYKTIDGVDLLMDLYFPSKPVAEKAPVVMDIPGGGWMIHNRNRRDGYARLFATMGAVVAVIEHRLCPDIAFPENLKDSIDALNFLKDIAEKYNLDTENVTLTGDSSGGHLSACIGCASTSAEYCEKLGLPQLKIKPVNIIAVSGAYSFDIMHRIPLTHTLEVRYATGTKNRTEYRNWKFYKEANPYNYLNKDFPESFNIGGGGDLLCLGEAKRMGEHLTAVGVKNEVVVGKNILNNGHCYCLRFPFAPARRDMVTLYGWYERKQAEKGVDMSEGYARVKKFLENYKPVLKGKMEC